MTVIIPTLGKSKHLLRALGSLLDQTYEPMQVIVVFDSWAEARSVQPQELLGKFNGRFSSFLVVESFGAKGAAANRNLGLTLAQGKYISFLDDDDAFLPDKVRLQVAFMESEACDFSHTNYLRLRIVDSDQQLRSIDTSRNKGRFVPQQISEGACLIATPTVMVRSSLIQKLSGKLFPEMLRTGEDQIAWMRLAHLSQVGVGHLALPLSQVLIRSDSLQRLESDSLSAIKNHFRLGRLLLAEAHCLGVRRSPRVWIENFFINQLGQAHLVLAYLRELAPGRNKKRL